MEIVKLLIVYFISDQNKVFSSSDQTYYVFNISTSSF